MRRFIMRVVAFLVIVVLMMSAGAPLVLAQKGPMGGQGNQGQEGAQKEYTPEQFPEAKARVLKLIDERKSRLDQEKACVEKATNHDELRKCRPVPPMSGPMQRGPGTPRPPMPGGQGGQ
jgi:hypothetical protein